METRVSITTLPTGEKQITITGNLPAASIEENGKYPYTPWNVSYQQKQLEKDGERLLQSLANVEYVETLVSGRSTNREASRAEKKRDRLAAQLVEAQAKVAALQASNPAS